MKKPVDCSVHFHRPYIISIVATSPNQEQTLSTSISTQFQPSLAESVFVFVYFAMKKPVDCSVHFQRPYIISIVVTSPNQEHILPSTNSTEFDCL